MNELQIEMKAQLEKFRQTKIEPTLESDDHDERFRMDIYHELGALGFAGITLPEEFGGMNLTVSDQCVALAELAKSSVSYAVTLSVSMMVQSIINSFGSKAQKEKYLPKLTSGEEIASFCLSESGAGSDAASLKTTAKKVDGGYVLNGAKMWITSAGLSTVYLVMARTGGPGSKGVSAFIVESGFEGFSVGKKERKMGWKVSPTCEVLLKDCFVPEANRVSAEGEGFKVAMSGLDKGRITIGSIAVGVAERALDESVKYSLSREQFGHPIFDFQGLQFMMADMATEVEAARLLVTRAAELFDAGKSDSKLASMAKLKATDVAMKVTTDAVQILGGVGYTSEYPVERLMRDAKVLQIVEGTNQVQRVVIARKLKAQYQG